MGLGPRVCIYPCFYGFDVFCSFTGRGAVEPLEASRARV